MKDGYGEIEKFWYYKGNNKKGEIVYKIGGNIC